MRLDKLTIRLQEAMQDPLALKLLDGSLKETDKVMVGLDAHKNLAFKILTKI